MKTNGNNISMRFRVKPGMTKMLPGMTRVLPGMTKMLPGMTRVLAVMLLAAAGCVRIETDGVGDTPMTFRSYTPRSTKAAAPTGVVAPGALPENTSFGVFAFYQPGVVWSSTGAWGNGGSRSTWHPNYMFNQKVDFDGSDYDYEPLRYWPANEENTISFWAYWPIEFYNAANNGGTLKFYDAASYQSNPASPNAYDSNSTGLPVARYTVSNVPSQQYDLLFDAFDNTDRYCDDHKNGAQSGEVPLRFRHVLSQLVFSITADGSSLPTGSRVQLNYFKLTDVNDDPVIYSVGDCPSPGASIAADDPNAHPENYWTRQTTPVNITLNSGSDRTVLLLMPQALAQDGSNGHSVLRLKMSYDIKFPAAHNPLDSLTYSDNIVDACLWQDDDDPSEEVDTSYGVKRWLPGRKYTYNIAAGLERIEFSEVTEASWTDEWPTPQNP